MEIVQFAVSKNAYKQAQQNTGFRLFSFNGKKKLFLIYCVLWDTLEKNLLCPLLV